MAEGQQEQLPPPGSTTEELMGLMGAAGDAVRDVARLAGLETRVVLRSLLIMLVLAVALGLVLATAWGALAVVIAIALYEYTGLGMTGSAAVVLLGNLAVVAAGVLALRHLARRLRYPETRAAVSAAMTEMGREGAGA